MAYDDVLYQDHTITDNYKGSFAQITPELNRNNCLGSTKHCTQVVLICTHCTLIVLMLSKAKTNWPEPSHRHSKLCHIYRLTSKDTARNIIGCFK